MLVNVICITHSGRPRRTSGAIAYSSCVRFLYDESGYGTLEYGLIVCLIAMIAIAALLFLGTGSDSSLSRSGNRLPDFDPNVGAPP
jgi:Flp pilus assembly pilin Flp